MSAQDRFRALNREVAFESVINMKAKDAIIVRDPNAGIRTCESDRGINVLLPTQMGYLRNQNCTLKCRAACHRCCVDAPNQPPLTA